MPNGKPSLKLSPMVVVPVLDEWVTRGNATPTCPLSTDNNQKPLLDRKSPIQVRILFPPAPSPLRTAVLISHDRRLLERISRTTIWLDRGITRTRDEGFKAFEPWRDALIEQEASERHKLGRKIAMEEDWLRYGVTARRTRNQRRLAELHALRRKRKAFRTPTPYVWRRSQRLRWLHYLAE